MIQRLASTAIVVFWFVMTILLVRNEVAPEGSTLQDVPISHVLKLLYMHEQPSDLNIFNGSALVGSLRLQPRVDRDKDLRALDISGDLRVEFSPGQKNRFNWIGLMEMTPAYELRHSRWKFAMLDPERANLSFPDKKTNADAQSDRGGGLRVEIETPAGSNITHYEVLNGTTSIAQSDVPEGASGLTSLAQQFGLGPSVNALISQSSQQAPPKITARQSSLRFHGERTDTYLVTVEQNGQRLVEAQISQLGQVLTAKTIIGYSLRLDTLNP